MLLTRHFIAQYNQKFGKYFEKIAPEAQSFLVSYHWPGNVRELCNTIERIILIEDGDTVTKEHLRILDCRDDIKMGAPPQAPVEHELDYNVATKNIIKEAMKTAGGNVSEAARLMNMPPHKLRYRIKKYGLTSQ